MGLLIATLPDELTIILVLAIETIILLHQRHQANTAAPAKPAKAARAFARLCAIPELHEMILQHLSVRELLRAKRVCRDWKDTIETSHPLLQKLWLRPRSSMRVGFKPGDRGIRRGHSWVSQNGLSISASDIVANPYFHADLSLERKPAPSLWWPNTSDSRREMYICNPPAVSVLLAGYSDGDSIFEEWLHDAAGIKIKQVVDFTLAKFLEWNGPECWMGDSTQAGAMESWRARTGAGTQELVMPGWKRFK